MSTSPSARMTASPSTVSDWPSISPINGRCFMGNRPFTPAAVSPPLRDELALVRGHARRTTHPRSGDGRNATPRTNVSRTLFHSNSLKTG